MQVDIFPIPLGVDRCYLIRAGSTMLIDGGVPKKAKLFEKTLKKAGVDLSEVELILLTHGHWDHIGSAAAIKELTGARIAMHAAEKERLEQGLKQLPPPVTAWGSIFMGFMKAFMMPFVRITPATVDIVVDDSGMSLADVGIPGRVVHTPGHSAGSLSVVLVSGDAFVGDLAMNGFPLRRGPGLPVFADDLERVKASWKTLLAQGATTIHPAHGKPFPADVIRRELEAAA